METIVTVLVETISQLNGFLNNIFLDSTSLYFYSTLFQGNAALVALMAMYVIYKRQSIDASFDRKANDAVNYLSRASNTTASYGNIFDLEFHNDEMFKNIDNETSKKNIKKTMKSETWKARFTELHELEDSRNNLWKDAKPSMSKVFIILIASILMLPFSNGIHKLPLVEFVFFLSFISFEVLVLFLLYNFIRSNSQ